jgi:hypothetical protein
MLLPLFMLLLAPMLLQVFLALFQDVACIYAVVGVSSVNGVHTLVFTHALAGTSVSAVVGSSVTGVVAL